MKILLLLPASVPGDLIEDEIHRSTQALEPSAEDPYLLGLYGIANAQFGRTEDAYSRWQRRNPDPLSGCPKR